MVAWHEEYPQVLEADLNLMRHGFPAFNLTKEADLQRADGEIRVEGDLTYDEGKIEHILIRFLHSYPFSSPLVYPIRNQILVNGPFRIQQASPFHFGKGSQFEDGRMCLFKEEADWIPFVHGMGQILLQTIHWLKAATSERGFTEDLKVNERLPVIPSGGFILHALPPEIPQGLKGKVTAKKINKQSFALIQLQIENDPIASLLQSIPDGRALTNNFAETIFGNYFCLPGQDPLSALPKMTDATAFKQYFMEHLGVSIDEIFPLPSIQSKTTIVGFGLGSPTEIHWFALDYWLNGTETMFKSTYLLSKNLDSELLIRVNDLYDTKVLSKKSILVVGIGAIGSEVVKELAAAGVGKYYLSDEETYDVGNNVRHAADLTRTGDLKTKISKDHIEGRNPFAKVQLLPGIFQLPKQKLAEIINSVDLIFDLTANPLVAEYLHQYAFLKGERPIIQAAVSMGGLSGNVLVMVPGETMCLECLRKKGLDSVPTPIKDISVLKETIPDLGMCSKPAIPASGIDTREVALMTARVALQFFNGIGGAFYPDLPGYQLYWNGPSGSKNEDYEINTPHSWYIRSEKASSDYTCCQK